MFAKILGCLTKENIGIISFNTIQKDLSIIALMMGFTSLF
jgi:hypothetical protein